MKLFYLFILSLAFQLSQGCATSGEAVGLGTGVGALVGGGVGAMADPGGTEKGRIRNIAIGTGAGAIVGAGAGYGAQKIVESREEKAFDKGRSDGKRLVTEYSAPGDEPQLLGPRVEAIYIDDQVRGNVFIPAHVEYRIVEPARWQK